MDSIIYVNLNEFYVEKYNHIMSTVDSIDYESRDFRSIN